MSIIHAHSTERVTGSEGREGANGVGAGNADVNGDGDGDGAGTRTGVEAIELTLEGEQTRKVGGPRRDEARR